MAPNFEGTLGSDSQSQSEQYLRVVITIAERIIALSGDSMLCLSFTRYHWYYRTCMLSKVVQGDLLTMMRGLVCLPHQSRERSTKPKEPSKRQSQKLKCLIHGETALLSTSAAFVRFLVTISLIPPLETHFGAQP